MKPNEVTEEMLTAFDAVLNLHDRIPDAIAAAINAMPKSDDACKMENENEYLRDALRWFYHRNCADQWMSFNDFIHKAAMKRRAT